MEKINKNDIRNYNQKKLPIECFNTFKQIILREKAKYLNFLNFAIKGELTNEKINILLLEAQKKIKELKNILKSDYIIAEKKKVYKYQLDKCVELHNSLKDIKLFLMNERNKIRNK